MMMLASSNRHLTNEPSSSGEQGWALLGLLLALGVMSIVLSSAVIPNVQMQVQRDKEAEMLYRGDQMARGIARFYARGQLAPLRIQLLLTSPYGQLTELAKLRDGVTLGVREIKFVRPSATIDPMTSSEWEPIRVRDPRLTKFLQAWLADTQTVDITPYRDYFQMAGPLVKGAFDRPTPTPLPLPNQPPAGAAPGQRVPPTPATPGNPEVRRPGQPPDEEDDDDDDDDDDVSNDPLARLFQSGSPGHSNAPIIGVVSKKKGKAMSSYFGLDNYEDWIFIYIPKTMPTAPSRVSQ
jgi:type II secretory pathway pseudopilin PulG